MNLEDSAKIPLDNENILEVRNLKKSFPVRKSTIFKTNRFIQAVRGINFKAQKSKTLSIVGESGSGKTTTARIILHLEQPDEGEVFFEGKNILNRKGKALQKLRREIQMIFQDPYSSLNPRKTVGQLISEPLKIHKICPGKRVKDRTVELLESVGLSSDIISNYPHEFSGGQRQRIGIARALTVNPKLIICDEPVSALDVSVRAQILNLLVELQESFGYSYIFIGHDLSVIKHVSHQVAVMYMGKIVELAPVNRFYANPLHPYSEALLSATPSINPKLKKKRIVLPGDVPSPLDPPAGCSFFTRCLIADKICSEQEPLLNEDSSGHFVACHLRGKSV